MRHPVSFNSLMILWYLIKIIITTNKHLWGCASQQGERSLKTGRATELESATFFLFGLCLHETYNTNIDRWSCCPSFLTAKIKSSHEREIIKSDRKKNKQKTLQTYVVLQLFSQNLSFFLQILDQKLGN